MSGARPKRALIVKLGAIGDVIMAIPAAQALRGDGYTIDWLCGETAAPILRLYPWINVLTTDERTILQGSTAQRIRALVRIWRLLRGRSYDLCATLYYDPRYELLTRTTHAGRKLRLDAADRQTTLLAGRHHTDEYARILLNRRDGEMPQHLAPIRPEALPPSSLSSAAQKPRIVIVPAGARNLLRDDALRRWPIESYVDLASALLHHGYEVVLSGGPDDTWASDAFRSMPVIDTIGKSSLLETLSLLNSADVTVTHDTGPLHLAGITSTAIVAIFGPTDPRGRLPQRENCVALWGGEGFACRPCYDGRDYAPCKHNGCVRQITSPMVMAEIDRLLAARSEGRNILPRIVVPEHTPIQVLESAQ